MWDGTQAGSGAHPRYVLLEVICGLARDGKLTVVSGLIEPLGGSGREGPAYISAQMA